MNDIKTISLKNNDILIYNSTKDALKDMKILAEANIHCVLHNFFNGNINVALGIQDKNL